MLLLVAVMLATSILKRMQSATSVADGHIHPARTLTGREPSTTDALTIASSRAVLYSFLN